MATKPTKRQIDEAKDFLRQRLAAEASMIDNLQNVMEKAARDIVEISCRYNIPPHLFRFSANKSLEKEVDEVIRWLKSLILDYIYTLAVASHNEDSDEIIAYITRDIAGKTLPQRTDIYTSRFKYEIEAAIAAGLILGIGERELSNSINSNLKAPYSNPYIADVIKQGGGYAATRLQTKGINYGAGHSTSMFTSLKIVSVYAVAEGWSFFSLSEARKKGATGFYTFRGSSYPCRTCDEYTRILHPLSDPLPPLHLNCVCGAVFVF